MDKISVILPVFNREDCVAEAIESILEQNYTNWQLLIIDDGSTDGSGAICDDYAAKDSRIAVFHTKNHGVSHARNIGLSKADGEWVAFIDSDDFYLPCAFEEMIKHTAEADMVVSSAISIPQNIIRGILTTKTLMLHPREDMDTLQRNRLVYEIWGKLYKREKIKHNFDETFSIYEDRLFNTEYLANIENIVFAPVFSYVYRKGLTGNSLTGCFDNRCLHLIHRIILRYQELFCMPEPDRFYLEEFVWIAVQRIYAVIKMGSLSELEKRMIISADLKYPILEYKGKVRPEALPPTYAKYWEILMTGDAEKVYHAFANQDAVIKKTLNVCGNDREYILINHEETPGSIN